MYTLAEWMGKLVKVVYEEGDNRRMVIGYITEQIRDKIKVKDREGHMHLIDLLIVRRISECVTSA